MGFTMRLCFWTILLISEICVLANPVIPQAGLSHESYAPKSTARQLFMTQNDRQEEEQPGDDTPTITETPTTEPPTDQTPEPTTDAQGLSSVNAPSFFLCVSVVMPIFLMKKLQNV